jgi:Tol biopolymer transport system component
VNIGRKSQLLLLTIAALAVAGYQYGLNRSQTLTGTLLFHNYTSYESWDGQLYTLDFEKKKLINLTASWKTVKHTINGSFSADGKFMTFMGSEKDLEDWDVFTTRWNGNAWEEPVNITGPNNKRDEDPKFSPKTNTIIYKENGVLTKISLTQDGHSAPTYLSENLPESSMPYFLPNGKDYLFERGGEIYLHQSGKDRLMYAGDGISSYYPIALDSKSFLYSRVQNSRHDGIMKGYYSGKKSESYFFNNDQWDSSDAFPYKDGSRFIFLVSGDYQVPKGGYNLVIADLDKKVIMNIDNKYGEVNTDLEELGPAWTNFSYRK